MIADGRIARVAAVVPLPTLAETNPVRPVQVAVVHGAPHPLSIAAITPVESVALGHQADLLNLLPLEQPETELPMPPRPLGDAEPAEPLHVPHNPAADAKPDTAPVRARQSKSAAERASDDDGRHKRKKGKR